MMNTTPWTPEEVKALVEEGAVSNDCDTRGHWFVATKESGMDCPNEVYCECCGKHIAMVRRTTKDQFTAAARDLNRKQPCTIW